jgi:anthranilate synthase component I
MSSFIPPASGTRQGRWSLLFAFPGEQITLDDDGRLRGAPKGALDFFDGLDRAWRTERPDAPGDPALPFTGGWFFYLSYELAGVVEPGLRLPTDPGVPVARAVRLPAAIMIDHREGMAWLAAEPGRRDCLAQMETDIGRLASGQAPAFAGSPLAAALREEPPGAYVEAVKAAKAYIQDGDIFQANLSRAWRGELAPAVTPGDLYRRLRRTNPGPFAGLAVFGEQAVISSSPERLVSVQGDRVDTRPIAGTRPRGVEGKPDEVMRNELIGHPKERAEHIMLIDLERNDLGRVCRPGTVEVNELMVLESYSHVHHIVSNVRGRLREGVTPGQVLRAVFPGGTITGCPKVRCMEIIAELEGRPRGAYTGALGYLDRSGRMDSNILIRTLETRGRDLSLLAGAGIVADSDPERELEETRAKARGMVLAVDPEARHEP